jgi:aspartyl-tRNA(Asn)/glutamyl-tRNA(Gln) amidotransferase subunit A
MITWRTAAQLGHDVAAGRLRAEEVCRAALERIARLDPHTGAFLEVCGEAALERARAIDRCVAAGGNPGPLAGVPVAIKDNISTRIGRTTCASRMLAGYRSPYDATAVERLEAAGAVVIGKTNLDEFAMGSSTENSGFAPTRNPWDPRRVPGGSSGGSAAAVAAGMVPISLGSDTGGSVRQPAALCGVVGLKPTYGRVSRYGLVAYGSSLDQIGPLARCTADAALALSVIAGPDGRDSTCLPQAPPDFAAALREDLVDERVRSLRLGVPPEYFAEGLDGEVRSAVQAALEVYRSLGVQTVEVGLPHTPCCVAAYYLIATAEASSNLARYDGLRYGHRATVGGDVIDLVSASRSEGFGAEVKRRIMLGTFALSSGYYDEYYLRALRVRRLIQEDLLRAFERVDLIVCPTTPAPAFALGEKTEDPLQMYLADVYTIAANLAGIPALSIPCGFSQAGLPIGLQLLGPPSGEELLLQAARAYERRTDWHERRPPICA